MQKENGSKEFSPPRRIQQRGFIECVREDKPPIVTGEDGRAVLEIMCAAYPSAGTNQKVPRPFRAKAAKPVDLWLTEILTEILSDFRDPNV